MWTVWRNFGWLNEGPQDVDDIEDQDPFPIHSNISAFEPLFIIVTAQPQPQPNSTSTQVGVGN